METSPKDRFFNLSHFLVFPAWGLLILKAWSVLLQPIKDPDLFWHLAAGKEMVENHCFLWTDVFSHPYFGKPWINTEWLFEIGAYLVEKYSGWEGIYWTKIGLSALVLVVMTGAFRKAGARGGLLFLLTALGVFLVQPRLYERAELWTLLFLGVELNLLLRMRRGSFRLFPWIMALIVAVWVNLHSGVVYGVALLALFNVGARWAREDPSFIKTLDLALVLACAALFLNPYGWRLLLFYGDVLKQTNAELHNVVLEWKRPTLSDAPVFWGVFVLSGGIMGEGILRKKVETIIWVPVVFVFSLWTSQHFRSTALMAFISLPMLADWAKSARWVRRPGPEVLLFLLGIFMIFPLSVKIKPPKSKVSWHLFPVRACRFIQSVGLEGTMYNTYQWGGYIQWTCGPSRKTFMDGRYLSYPLAVQESNALTDLLQRDDAHVWEQRLASYGIDYAVSDYIESFWKVGEEKSRFPEVLFFERLFPMKNWALIFWDDTSLVFVRRIPRWASLINAHEYRALKPYRMDRFVSPILETRDFAEALRSELTRHRAEVDFSLLRSEIEKRLSSASRN